MAGTASPPPPLENPPEHHACPDHPCTSKPRPLIRRDDAALGKGGGGGVSAAAALWTPWPLVPLACKTYLSIPLPPLPRRRSLPRLEFRSEAFLCVKATTLHGMSTKDHAQPAVFRTPPPQTSPPPPPFFIPLWDRTSPAARPAHVSPEGRSEPRLDAGQTCSWPAAPASRQSGAQPGQAPGKGAEREDAPMHTRPRLAGPCFFLAL